MTALSELMTILNDEFDGKLNSYAINKKILIA
jgi:hypothetical protein